MSPFAAGSGSVREGEHTPVETINRFIFSSVLLVTTWVFVSGLDSSRKIVLSIDNLLDAPDIVHSVSGLDERKGI